MTGRLYIDDNDAYLQYGVYVVKGGWNELVAMPPLKSYDSNDWQEEDGIEADLSAPVLNSREVQLKVAVSGLDSRFFSLIELLSDGAYHVFNCASIQRIYVLRLVSQTNFATVKTLGTATLKLADDFPLLGYTYTAPSTTIAEVNDYTIDGVPFTAYGVRILIGTLGEVLRTADVKTALLRNIVTLAGALYDIDSVVRYKSKDVKLYCLMRADTLTELWRNYDALLYDITRPGEHTLWVNEVEEEFKFVYKSCQVTDFYPTDKIWLQFTLTVTFTCPTRITDDDIVLATEDGVIVSGEDGDNAINMN
jgi:hypothetical protein